MCIEDARERYIPLHDRDKAAHAEYEDAFTMPGWVPSRAVQPGASSELTSRSWPSEKSSSLTGAPHVESPLPSSSGFS